MEVERGFEGFRRKSDVDLPFSMRRMLRNKTADAARHDEGTANRQVSRERSFDEGESTLWSAHPTRWRYST